MIGRIAGIIIHRAQDHVLIDVRGVGYIVHVSDRTGAGLPPVGQAAALYTELVVREDLLQLFGFTTMLEKEWHRLLTSVQGVGAKVSLAILGTLGPEGLGRAIALGDWASVRKANGVGPKLAQRIVLELKDKVGVAETWEAAGTDEGGGAARDAELALLALGFKQAEARKAIAAALKENPAMETEELIRVALRGMS